VSAVKTERLEISSEADMIVARRVCKRTAAKLGFDLVSQTRLATAISELVRNVLIHARAGTMTIERLKAKGLHGLKVVIADKGPGIDEIERAMDEGYTTGDRLGMGLPAAKRLVDDFNMESFPGEGTTVTIVLWKRAGYADCLIQ